MSKNVILGGTFIWVAATAYMMWFLLTVSGDSPSWKWTLGSLSGLIFVIGLILLAIGGISAIMAGRREKKMWAE